MKRHVASLVRDVSVNPDPNEAGQSNAGPANAGSPEVSGRPDSKEPIPSLQSNKGEQLPAGPTVEPSNREPQILQAEPTIQTSPVGEQPKQPARSAAEEVANAGARGMAKECGKCLCEGGLRVLRCRLKASLASWLAAMTRTSA